MSFNKSTRLIKPTFDSLVRESLQSLIEHTAQAELAVSPFVAASQTLVEDTGALVARPHLLAYGKDVLASALEARVEDLLICSGTGL